MKRLKRKIAFYLTLCMLFTCAIPAYAEEITVPEAVEIPGIAEETSPAEAEYVAAKPFDAEYEATEKDPEDNAIEKATPSDAKKNEEVFIRETVVDGIKITLTADPGVFPEDAEFWVEKVEDEAAAEAIEEAVEKERDNNVNVALSYKFDIKMFVNGEEVQPDTEKGSVKITFTMAEVLGECMEANAYHIKEDTKTF